ncbi:MAG: hypothetical protein R2825_08350 [Saprospiraceae bacterium]
MPNLKTAEVFEQTKFKTFVKEYGMFMTWPDFTEEMLEWQGKEVMLMGYIIPTCGGRRI